MLVEDPGKDQVDMYRKALQDRVIREGMELWNKQKECERMKKVKEQKEIREMLDNYWPWGKGTDKPRGLRNLRLEELFPNKDYQKAKRFVGTLDLGRGGGGAPMVNSGRKITRTREDPILRFQFGSKDLRRCVDNTLRYKTSKENQQEYKKQLDKLVQEKKLKEEQEKANTKLFHQEQGWSDHSILRGIEDEEKQNKSQDSRTYENFKRMKMIPPNKVTIDPVVSHKKNFIPVGKNRKLSPLSNNKDDGVELVHLLAKNRNYPPKIPLSSTDVTAHENIIGLKTTILCSNTPREPFTVPSTIDTQPFTVLFILSQFTTVDGTVSGFEAFWNIAYSKSCIWNRQGSSYLKELTRQMLYKQQKLKEQKEKEIEFVRRHFSTLDAFWGKPGNGAPLEELKKQSLDRLLYPQMFPVGVH